MTVQSVLLVLLACVGAWSVWAQVEKEDKKKDCELRARTSGGWVCGARRWSEYGGVYYASFRGVPYARQPLGELRFKELEPPEPWNDVLNATSEGPICPQTDVFYGPLMKPRNMSEACIHANIHVPILALPCKNEGKSGKPLDKEVGNTTGLPILVFIHGGGFAFGSGDSDLHGPEYLVSNGIIVITFNYRLNVFGFLSLNSTKIPGNNGLRDMITLLRWVRDNAHNFGGNPNDVTLGGQSAGAVSAHLLTLSHEAQGLFKRAILMSGTAIPAFFTTSPLYAQYMANAFLTGLGITSTDPDDIHQQLVKMPLEKIMWMNKLLIDQNGLVVFYPVAEAIHPGVKRILSDDPEILIQNGVGKEIPLLVGFTDVEAESFRRRFEELDMVSRIDNNPLLVLSPTVIFSLPQEVAFARAKKVKQRYFDSTPSMDQYVKLATEYYFQYPALKLAEYRQRSGTPVLQYQFSYNADYSPLRTALHLNYTGAGHVDDMTYLFHCNSVRVPKSDRDEYMKRLMNYRVVGFMRNNNYDTLWPKNNSVQTCLESPSWQPYLEEPSLRVQPTPAELTPDQRSMVAFFDGIMARSITSWEIAANSLTQNFTFLLNNSLISGLVRSVTNLTTHTKLKSKPKMLSILSMLSMYLAAVSTENIVITTQGRLRGTPQDGYVSYTGVPYAAISEPAGKFKKAGLAPFWLGVREALIPNCFPTSEVDECLRLDVHVPNSGSPWPVFLWVSGGSGRYQPRKLVQEGVIVVVVYHRLGPVGFLCLNEDAVPGNAGAKDVVLALRWVRDNIVAFRGNPAKVVVAGQGFGAAIVEALLLSPMAQGLFHGAIMQSGTVLSPWYFNYDAEDRANVLGNMFSENDDITSALLNADIADLVANAEKLVKPYFPFGMCVERVFNKDERLLSELPIDLLSSKKAFSVPLIIGYNSDEAYIFASNLKAARVLRRILRDMTFLLPEELKINKRESFQVARKLGDVYFKNNLTMASVLAYHRDAYFINHIYRSVRLHATSSHHPVYLYQFSYVGGVGVEAEPGVKKTGAAHSDELAYLLSGKDLEGEDGTVQQRLVKLWSNFAKYLTPTPRLGDSSSWDPVEAHNPRLLNIGAELKMDTFPHKRLADMWDDIYEKYYYSRYRSSIQ
ncbi:uncharacterized protein LOC126375040 [Pectinophora gossypiella]|uniref:uncharacterized protein LOC126375040 n=1 Tax=Pectinophora gossypiella TaxID=13191 RepID=UPI00214F5FBA|nr:uncharacterized protein LOC126375040 [Pectinophora gossypiella]